MTVTSIKPGYFSRDHFIVYSAMLVVCLAAWGYMAYMAWAMQNMDVVDMWMPPRSGARAWQLHDFWMLFSMWAVMMIAMMTPSVLPMVSMYVTVTRSKKDNGQSYTPTIIFLCGYLIAWIFFSVVISIVQYPLHIYALLNPMMDSRSYLLSGVILMLAGIYQWTPWKDACLEQCRSPLNYLMTSWREGHWGAVRMGLHHGIYCIGCCWALMAVMFAVGVMNVMWMLAIAFFVLAEKISPVSAKYIRIVSGVVLVVWGVYWLMFNSYLSAF
jgi:predicted metal-binding membrane protein